MNHATSNDLKAETYDSDCRGCGGSGTLYLDGDRHTTDEWTRAVPCPICQGRPSPYPGATRRSMLDQLLPAEMDIRLAIQAVERLGAHEMLTRAVIHMNDALQYVADWAEGGDLGSFRDPRFDDGRKVTE